MPGLRLRPQVTIQEPHFLARVDLADEYRRLALEADSHEFHAGRAAFARDCRRYNQLVAHGWLVLRFSWEDVLLQPGEVAETLLAAVAGRPQVRYRRRRST